MLVKSQWSGVNLTRTQLATRFLDRSVPRNLRQVLAQIQSFRARFETARRIRPNGFTMDAQGNVRDYTRGYAVGTHSYDTVDELIFNNQNVLACGDRSTLHFGYWQTNDGAPRTFIDAVEVIDTLPDALRVAARYGQIAIYDFAGKKDIPVSSFNRYTDCIVCLKMIEPYTGAYTHETGVLAHRGECYETRNAQLTAR